MGRGTEEHCPDYGAALEAAYPAAKGNTRVLPWQEGGFLVSVPLPTRVNERMRLFDRMAEVGTDLLKETGEYFLLTSIGEEPRDLHAKRNGSIRRSRRQR